MASQLYISCDQGSDHVTVLTIKDSSGAAVNITGYTFAGQARANYTDATALVTFLFVIKPQAGATLGQVEWLVPNTTSKLSNVTQSLVYDVEMTDAAGRKTRLVEGVLTLNPEVTRA